MTGAQSEKTRLELSKRRQQLEARLSTPACDISREDSKSEQHSQDSSPSSSRTMDSQTGVMRNNPDADAVLAKALTIVAHVSGVTPDYNLGGRVPGEAGLWRHPPALIRQRRLASTL
ncbi:uncharacterized protein RCC_06638 [Ramularia collo-cygni]|uniref:Uncharacterized protein n=1 Tax=Ramularia collo-cygni TaxID=112498 RepID=A0A2D3V5P6_9PEZI|nr:uncharacterized protein RCC_06638 [Ramularia collo-cygni]CZT20780.1 uncharacterized protein RCC_06638 [Ramularia collo-cygni]